MPSELLRRSVLVVAIFLVGCSRGPSPVEAPPIEPAKNAEAILSQYDADQDGRLSKGELASCPALLGAIAHYDNDGDDQISVSELIKRFEGWVSSGIGVSTLACRVTMKGNPLSGAEISFVPEDCFADVLQPAKGTTDRSGTAMLTIDASHLPADARNIHGVQQGLYRVEIHHPEIDIPAKYNSDSTLGKEISFELGENFITFSL